MRGEFLRRATMLVDSRDVFTAGFLIYLFILLIVCLKIIMDLRMKRALGIVDFGFVLINI